MSEFTTRVLVADSHTLARGGMMALLSNDLSLPKVTGVDDFESLTAAVSAIPGIGLLLLDSELPGMGGMPGLRKFRQQRPDLHVVLLAARENRADALEALSLGVHGYLPKDLPPKEMAQAIRMTLNGQIYVPATICDQTLEGSDPSGDWEGRSLGELTGRQREVLTHLTAGLSNKEIARALNIAEGTVKVHLAAAFRALHVHNRVGAAIALQRLGTLDRREQPDLPGVMGDFQSHA